MPRAPFQVLVIPFRRVADRVEFAVLRRKDMNVWQGVAGGGEAGETPQEATVREIQEELGLDRLVLLYPLQTVASIPARFFEDRSNWPVGTYVVPENSFAADLTEMEIKISDEHTDVLWLDYAAASKALRFDSNRTALDELHERLLADDLPLPID